MVERAAGCLPRGFTLPLPSRLQIDVGVCLLSQANGQVCSGPNAGTPDLDNVVCKCNAVRLRAGFGLASPSAAWLTLGPRSRPTLEVPTALRARQARPTAFQTASGAPLI